MDRPFFKKIRKRVFSTRFLITIGFTAFLLIGIMSTNTWAKGLGTKHYSPIATVFAYLGSNMFVFLFLSLSLGYPLGKITIKGVNLGATAGTLIVGIALSLTAFMAFGITYSAPGLVSTIFLLMFMYAIGIKVGPQFFSGIARGGMDFVVIGLIVAISNFLICFIGAKLVNMAPGYGAGIISGSYTITAVMGVAQSAVASGAVTLPQGMTANTVGANLAAGYAISYVLSSIFTILVIKYLPVVCGIDPVQAGRDAEASFGAGQGEEALPGTFGSSMEGVSPMDIRAYKVEHQELVGQSIEDLFHKNPHAAVYKVLRDDKLIDASDNPKLKMGDIIGVRGFYAGLISEGEKTLGTEVDEPRVRNVMIEVADVHVGKTKYAGKTVEHLGRQIGFGLYVKALFRQGHPIPHLPKTIIEVGDVIRLAGPEWCVNMAAKKFGGRPILESAITETTYLAIAMVLGYLVGHFSVTLGGIPFALGTSAGCMVAGILFSWWRTRNPAFGGPMSEGARSFMQDIGLNLFIGVLAANVGPKILQSFQGTVVIWITVFGLLGALVPPILAWIYGLYFRKMNPAILQGAVAGARNHTPSMKAAQEICQSDIPAVGYPVPYAITSALVLILGYLTMVLS
ncbi:MAG: transporter [Desulfobacteraceae bacterium]|nr:transporter [Desulfobacteraceae bacterium]